MKKEIVFLSAFVAVAASAATGVIDLDSTSTDVPIFFVSPGTKAPSEVFIEVLASAPGANSFSVFDSMSETKGSVLYTDMGSGKGSAYYFYETAATVTQVVPGTSADFIVRAWTGAATYDSATIKAESAIITQNTAVYNGLPDRPPTNPLTFNTALTMEVVPEPATIALLALGGAALFLRRRQ